MKRLIALIFPLILTGVQALSASASPSPQICYAPSFNANGLMAAAGAPRAAATASQLINGGYISAVGMTSAAISAQSNCLNIERGNVLLSPNTDLCVGTHNASLYLKAGATVFVMESEQDMVLYDLSQTAAKQVSILVDKNMLVMHPGQVLVLTKQNAQSFDTLEARCHSIPYRRTQQIDLPNTEIKAFVAQFSILWAMGKIQPLRQLVASTDKRDKIVSERILRCAIALGNVN